MSETITFTKENHPLTLLYGDDALLQASIYINELKRNSNFEFTPQYMSTGIGFTNINATKVLNGEEKNRGLKTLVGESFEAAAMFEFQFRDQYEKDKMK